jgi:hypothetical protein
MKKDNYVNVYWAPFIHYINGHQDGDWSMLYPDPKNLYSEISKLKVKNPEGSYLICPAVKNNFKNTFIFKNVLNSEYNYDVNLNPVISPASDKFLAAEVVHTKSITSGPIFRLSLSYIFFSDEDLETLFFPPMFNKPEYTNYGTIMPGEFNIGSWFRPYNFEIQMWENSGRLIIKEDEPLFYSKFLTNKKINLQRFAMNEKLYNYAYHCSTSSSTIKNNISLIERYSRFKESRMKDMILKEIKQNLILKQGEY